MQNNNTTAPRFLPMAELVHVSVLSHQDADFQPITVSVRPVIMDIVSNDRNRAKAAANRVLCKDLVTTSANLAASATPGFRFERINKKTLHATPNDAARALGPLFYADFIQDSIHEAEIRVSRELDAYNCVGTIVQHVAA